MQLNGKIAILGAGNIGFSIAKGLISSKAVSFENLLLTNKNLIANKRYREMGYQVYEDNEIALKEADLIILAVENKHLESLLKEIAPNLDANRHLVVSVIASSKIEWIKNFIPQDVKIARIMPNTAISICESMTCITMQNPKDEFIMNYLQELFNHVGKTLILEEGDLAAATALGSCGIAFFLRAIRAASQGGIEIGFHSDAALTIASQTAKGAASLLLANNTHPEAEIDRVTTPRGITIAGLNHMEHEGFSAAMISGITLAAEKFINLRDANDKK